MLIWNERNIYSKEGRQSSQPFSYPYRGRRLAQKCPLASNTSVKIRQKYFPLPYSSSPPLFALAEKELIEKSLVAFSIEMHQSAPGLGRAEGAGGDTWVYLSASPHGCTCLSLTTGLSVSHHGCTCQSPITGVPGSHHGFTCLSATTGSPVSHHGCTCELPWVHLSATTGLPVCLPSQVYL